MPKSFRAAMLLGSLGLLLAACGSKEAPPRQGSGSAGMAGIDDAGGGGSRDAGSGAGSGGADGGAIDASGIIMVDHPVDAAVPQCDAGRAPVTKIDLLFMIDNSSSMADKQTILAAAVPDLVNRLVDPPCIDPKTSAQVGTRRPDGTCAVGVPDFDPVKDIHIGIITSSLGGHGSTGVCDDPDPRKTLSHNDDKGHLVARTSSDAPVPTFENKGFLNWNPAPGSNANVATDITAPFQTMAIGVGQHGCGYEAQLEAIYRFLIDPDPYGTIEITPTAGSSLGLATPTGTDAALLQQRADFLRPDSLVAVIALTDENDCSIIDGGQYFYSILPATGFPPTTVLGHGTSACLTNPNDPCCVNCFTTAPAGCPDKAADPECQKGALSAAEDPANLRCWQQKRRYGIDFLQPVQRYIDGFTKSQVPDRANNPVKNPLYSDLQCKGGVGCLPARDKDLVFFAGILGVPWQDIAIDPGDLTKGYQTARDLAAHGVWAKIVGDPHNASGPVEPSDPHMIESTAPRAGLAPPTAAENADPINGHEWDPSKADTPNSDLQFACTFALSPAKTCTNVTDCDCFPPSTTSVTDNPLCQDRATGVYSTTQSGGKAYPGIRELEVLKGLGDQAIVGSICPANLTNNAAADYGYRPVIAAIVNRIRTPLRGCTIIN